MNATWNDLPMITCPCCDKEFQMDDYGDVSIGDEIDCYKCEKTLCFVHVETIVSVKVEPNPKEEQCQKN